MSDTVIKVENLSKKYIISHQSQEKYTALRDVLTNGAKRLGKKLLSPFTLHPSHDPLHPSRSSDSPFTDSQEDFYALKDVSFEIKQGDRVGIIGRNGAGKSTLLKILSRITEPTSGRIEITGRVASLLEVGTGFHPELTGRENIFLNGAILGMGKAEIKRKFDEIVDFAEVEKFLDTPVKRYSSGMYVRLAFAVAAHLEPEILIVDEVLAVGDAQFQKKCLGKMEDVGKEGRTVLFVSHNMAAITKLCSSAIFLSGGKVMHKGAIESVVNKYLETSAVSKSSQLWSDTDAPCDDVVVLQSARIMANGKTSDSISISDEIEIEIVYRNKISNANLMVSYHLMDKNDVCVLATANSNSATLGSDPMSGIAYPEGCYRSICRLPRNFLNEGMYKVRIILLTDINDIHIKLDDALAFTVVETGEMRKEFTGEWIGVVRPKLPWYTERVG